MSERRYTAPTPVGLILKEEFLEPSNISVSTLSHAAGVHRNTISAVINGGDISRSLSVKLAAALGTSCEFWLNLQHQVNLWKCRNKMDEISKNVKPLDIKPLN